MSAVEDPSQERRITFCLYEYWESLAGGTGLPALKNLKRADIEPFKNNLVLLDLRNNDQPVFQVIGQDLQEDLDIDLTSKPVKDVPRRTMLSRVTDHYMEVLSNRVPIAFEAEFVNRDNEKALYRGILLPFSDDNNNINFILGGVRWILAKNLHLEDGKPTIEELMRNISEGREDNLTQEPAEEAPPEPEIIQEEVAEIVVEEVTVEVVTVEEEVVEEDNLSEDGQAENITQNEIIANEPFDKKDAPVDESADEISEEPHEEALLEEEAAEEREADIKETDDETYLEVDEDEPSLAEDITQELTGESQTADDASPEPLEEETPSPEMEDVASTEEVAPEQEKKKISVIEKAMKFLSPDLNQDKTPPPDPSEEAEPEAIMEDETAEADVTASPEVDVEELETDTPDEVAPQTKLEEEVSEIEDVAEEEVEESDVEESRAEAEEIEEDQTEEEEAEEDVIEIDDKQQSLARLHTTLDQIIGYINKEDANHNRSRDSLYNILTVIYEFHETCEHSPDAFIELVKEHDLKIQARAPFTPVLKICLGKDYDKTRLTEYAAALGIARYMNVETSEFHAFIKSFPGGIKGCVKEMRAIRKSGKGGNVTARKTRTIEEAREILRGLSPISSFRLKKVVVGKDVDEYCLLLARRDGHKIDVLKILDDKFTKLEPILKRTAFIKGNLNIRK